MKQQSVWCKSQYDGRATSDGEWTEAHEPDSRHFTQMNHLHLQRLHKLSIYAEGRKSYLNPKSRQGHYLSLFLMDEGSKIKLNNSNNNIIIVSLR